MDHFQQGFRHLGNLFRRNGDFDVVLRRVAVAGLLGHFCHFCTGQYFVHHGHERRGVRLRQFFHELLFRHAAQIRRCFHQGSVFRIAAQLFLRFFNRLVDLLVALTGHLHRRAEGFFPDGFHVLAVHSNHAAQQRAGHIHQLVFFRSSRQRCHTQHALAAQVEVKASFVALLIAGQGQRRQQVVDGYHRGVIPAQRRHEVSVQVVDGDGGFLTRGIVPHAVFRHRGQGHRQHHDAEQYRKQFLHGVSSLLFGFPFSL